MVDIILNSLLFQLNNRIPCQSQFCDIFYFRQKMFFCHHENYKLIIQCFKHSFFVVSVMLHWNIQPHWFSNSSSTNHYYKYYGDNNSPLQLCLPAGSFLMCFAAVRSYLIHTNSERKFHLSFWRIENHC